MIRLANLIAYFDYSLLLWCQCLLHIFLQSPQHHRLQQLKGENINIMMVNLITLERSFETCVTRHYY